MLIVLFIVLSISFISAKITIKLSEKTIVDHFFHQLLLDIQMAQTFAMENRTNVIVSFSSKNNYQIYYHFEDIIEFREFPSIVELDYDASHMTAFRLNHNGEIDKFGKIIFNTPFGQKTLVVYIKKGRVRYVE